MTERLFHGLIENCVFYEDCIEFDRSFDHSRMRFNKEKLHLTFADPFEQAGLPTLVLTEDDAERMFGEDWKTKVSEVAESEEKIDNHPASSTSDLLRKYAKDIQILLGSNLRSLLESSAQEIDTLKKERADLMEAHSIDGEMLESDLKACNVMKERVNLLESALKPILACNWKLLAGEHGTEYGDDKQFDTLLDLISNAQRKVNGANK